MLSLVTWNSGATVEACLRSALAQTYRDFEFWIVDNASVDDTCARVAAFAAADPRVRLHPLATNTGFCGGHNYSLDRTRSDYVLLVNPDIEMAPDYLARAVAAMQTDARIGTVCGLLVQSAEADPCIDSAGMDALPDGRFQLRQHGQRLSQAGPLTAHEVDGADGALPLYRRRFIDDLRVEGQFFDERFFAHKEDWDVAWRGRLYGWRTLFEPACRAVHPRCFRPADLKLRRRLSASMKQEAVKNQLLLLLKNLEPGRMVPVLARALPRQLAILAYSVLLERDSLQGYASVWRQRRAVWHSRQLVQHRARQPWVAPPLPAAAAGSDWEPLLSICVPTYHRPEMLARTLRSLGPLPDDVELIVSDNSTDNNFSEHMTRHVLDGQPAGQWRYFRNEPGGTVTSNWTHCLRRARGHFVHMLHDDDYLLPGALATMLRTLRVVRGQHEAVLFGVSVVDIQGNLISRKQARAAGYLPPAVALEQVLTDSSFVRIPAIVVSRAAYQADGLPDPTQLNTDDTELWARLFARYGVYRVPECVAAYTVHPGAQTTGVFNERIIGLLLRVFQKADKTHLLSQSRLRRAQALFFHQFILAGAYRSLRRRDVPAARRVLSLFAVPALRALPVPLRWLPVRMAFELLTWLGLPVATGRPT
ncbi:glycosyltransferase family 2 protein [Hymenobacter algoricola]|uniref:glycosyltransferase family 2 protein n=1 Tax=Hymenobacter algoricola TaxID=486267 RepID=UPI0031EE2C6D